MTEETSAETDLPTPDEPEPPEPLAPPVPSPFAGLPVRPPRVLATAFDVLTQASSQLRRASFYIGLIVLGLAAPVGLLTWRIAVELPDFGVGDSIRAAETGLAQYFDVLLLIALLGLVIATIESRAVAISLLAARLEGRSLELRDAVERSRTIFWRLLIAAVLTNVPLLLVQSFIEGRLTSLFGGQSEVSVLSASLLAAGLFTPFAYVQTCVVLGDVAPVEAVKRSFRLFRAGGPLAVVVALFEFGSQLVTLFGLTSGLDLVARLAEAAGLGSSNDPTSTAISAAVVVVLLFAIGTLIFTVAAISVAPQVVAFLALTHVAPGLDRIGAAGRRFRWLTRPMLAAMALGALVLYAGLAALG